MDNDEDYQKLYNLINITTNDELLTKFDELKSINEKINNLCKIGIYIVNIKKNSNSIDSFNNYFKKYFFISYIECIIIQIELYLIIYKDDKNNSFPLDNNKRIIIENIITNINKINNIKFNNIKFNKESTNYTNNYNYFNDFINKIKINKIIENDYKILDNNNIKYILDLLKLKNSIYVFKNKNSENIENIENNEGFGNHEAFIKVEELIKQNENNENNEGFGEKEAFGKSKEFLNKNIIRHIGIFLRTIPNIKNTFILLGNNNNDINNLLDTKYEYIKGIYMINIQNEKKMEKKMEKNIKKNIENEKKKEEKFKKNKEEQNKKNKKEQNEKNKEEQNIKQIELELKNKFIEYQIDTIDYMDNDGDSKIYIKKNMNYRYNKYNNIINFGDSINKKLYYCIEKYFKKNNKNNKNNFSLTNIDYSNILNSFNEKKIIINLINKNTKDLSLINIKFKRLFILSTCRIIKHIYSDVYAYAYTYTNSNIQRTANLDFLSKIIWNDNIHSIQNLDIFRRNFLKRNMIFIKIKNKIINELQSYTVYNENCDIIDGYINNYKYYNNTYYLKLKNDMKLIQEYSDKFNIFINDLSDIFFEYILKLRRYSILSINLKTFKLLIDKCNINNIKNNVKNNVKNNDINNDINKINKNINNTIVLNKIKKSTSTFTNTLKSKINDKFIEFKKLILIKIIYGISCFSLKETTYNDKEYEYDNTNYNTLFNEYKELIDEKSTFVKRFNFYSTFRNNLLIIYNKLKIQINTIKAYLQFQKKNLRKYYDELILYKIKINDKICDLIKILVENKIIFKTNQIDYIINSVDNELLKYNLINSINSNNLFIKILELSNENYIDKSIIDLFNKENQQKINKTTKGGMILMRGGDFGIISLPVAMFLFNCLYKLYSMYSKIIAYIIVKLMLLFGDDYDELNRYYISLNYINIIKILINYQIRSTKSFNGYEPDSTFLIDTVNKYFNFNTKKNQEQEQEKGKSTESYYCTKVLKYFYKKMIQFNPLHDKDRRFEETLRSISSINKSKTKTSIPETEQYINDISNKIKNITSFRKNINEDKKLINLKKNDIKKDINNIFKKYKLDIPVINEKKNIKYKDILSSYISNIKKILNNIKNNIQDDNEISIFIQNINLNINYFNSLCIQIPVKDNRNYYENYIDHIITNNILLDSNDYYDDNNINIYNYNFIYGYYNNIDKSLYYYRFIDKNKNIDKEYYCFKIYKYVESIFHRIDNTELSIIIQENIGFNKNYNKKNNSSLTEFSSLNNPLISSSTNSEEGSEKGSEEENYKKISNIKQYNVTHTIETQEVKNIIEDTTNKDINELYLILFKFYIKDYYITGDLSV